jgi:peroxiredoxin
MQAPSHLAAPIDDGACERLIDLSKRDAARTVVFCYSMTGVPGAPLPEGWDLIPGARGCTPQTCAFRDHYQELATVEAELFGLSTQTTAYQREMAERLHLPFETLSDSALAFANALRLPTFEAGGMRLIKRLTLVIRGGRIETVFYPVFPSNESAARVIAWLERHPL